MRFFSGTLLPSNFIALPVSKKLRAIGFSINSSVILLVLALLISTISFSQNAIVTENALLGNPASEWDIVGAGDPTIQGFSTELSVNKGQTIFFKIKTDASDYSINIYRIGYYKGNGARRIASGVIAASLPQVQPQPLYETATGKTDCSNWQVSGKWVVPTTAVSGVYIAKLTRKDNGNSSHIIFIVRDDAAKSNLLFKTSDATWQAYNNYGGNALYDYISSIPVPGFKQSVKVSYNRPFSTRGGNVGNGVRESFFFNAEYAMIRWLERNGYELSYTTQIDIARRTTPIDPLKHKVLLSVGHDEYWSAEERNIYTSARNAGVNLAFFSGNEVYWKTRWEDNYRTLVCYKESETSTDPAYCNGKCDPNQNVWTGLWRAGCSFTNADGCRPENELTGHLSAKVSTSNITVPWVYKKIRFWRNTAIANLPDGQSTTLTPNSLGYEWDQEQPSTTYPAGRIILSNTQVGTDVHKMSLYRHSSKALVFGAGTINWAYGLDGVHDISSSVEDVNMQQATINLFADMGVQPGSLQSNLVAATSSNDIIPPSSIINPPRSTITAVKGKAVVITGTATDAGGGLVGGVEISTNGGVTWGSADGTENWTYSFTPLTEGQFTIISRSFDDLGNIENVTAANVTTITVAPSTCPCKIFKATDVPSTTVLNETTPVEIGVKFKSLIAGKISGLRYYKAVGQRGIKTGHLWKKTGTLTGDLLATAAFANETAGGWQEILFDAPVAINANETYVASIFSASGDYNVDRMPGLSNAINSNPLIALADGADGGNGVYNQFNSAYPANSYQQSNYWVDVVFTDVQSATLPVIFLDPASLTLCSGNQASFTATATGMPSPTIQWQVSLNNITWSNINNAQAQTLTFLPVSSDSGKYYRAAFSNAAGIVYTKSATLNVSFVTTVIAFQTNATCIGGDGSIRLNASGGFFPYTFNINGGQFQANAQFSNLNAGSYSFVVKDAIGCTASLPNVVISQNAGINITLALKKDVTCLGNDGSILVKASNGTAPYSFNINGSNFQATETFSNLTPGV